MKVRDLNKGSRSLGTHLGDLYLSPVPSSISASHPSQVEQCLLPTCLSHEAPHKHKGPSGHIYTLWNSPSSFTLPPQAL